MTMADVSQKIIDDIKSIDFFKHCGTQQECLYPNITYVSDDVMEKSISSLAWENYRLEQANQMSVYLFKNANQDFQYWNDYAKAFKAKWADIEPSIYQAMTKQQLNTDVMASIQWDFIHYYIMKSFYRHKLPKFFEQLFLIYQSGFLPCGADDYHNIKYPNILIY